MQRKRVTRTLMTLVWAWPMTVFAHPGHVHGPGPVHGFSWIDLAGFLVMLGLPVAVLALAEYRRNRKDD